MHRRKLLKFAALGAAGILVSSGAFVFFEKFDYLARKIVMKDTAMLNIDSTVYDQFFSDVEKQRKWDKLFDKQHKHLLKWHYYIDNPLFRLHYASNYQVNRAKIVNTFLLSTDFFVNKMDVSRPIKYRMLFDPFLYPCSNPFSNLYYPDV